MAYISDHRIQTHIYAEHIGIGISSRRVSPLLNLPKFYHVPVVAYESGAVPETLGGSGVLLPTCKPDEIAEVLDSVIRNPATREQIITGQLRRVESFIESKPRRELIRVLESIQK